MPPVIGCDPFGAQTILCESLWRAVEPDLGFLYRSSVGQRRRLGSGPPKVCVAGEDSHSIFESGARGAEIAERHIRSRKRAVRGGILVRRLTDVHFQMIFRLRPAVRGDGLLGHRP
jgi:hypothetical protein